MSLELECRKCGNNLEQWNNGRSLWINYCPFCGTKVLKKQGEALRHKTTVEEVSDIIRVQLLDLFDSGCDVPAGELADGTGSQRCLIWTSTARMRQSRRRCTAVTRSIL
jgi:DNA-directed RNA polymerase subunit RPC12/RpoP